MKRMSGLFSLAMAMAVTLPAQAQFAKPEDAVKYRKASFTVMSAHFGRLGAMANGRVPYDAKAAAENADVALTLSKLPWAASTRALETPPGRIRSFCSCRSPNVMETR